jgi:Tfp pilus assembly protein PilV
VNARLKGEQGFALIEMLAAIVLINIALLAILLAMNSGMVALRRSAETSTASAIADQQLERFRARAFSAIYLDTSSLAAADSTYRSDSAYSASQVTQSCSPLVAACTPSQNVTGPNGRTYRVDTYIVSVVPAGGAAVKQITVVVRKPGAPATLARTSRSARDRHPLTRGFRSRQPLKASALAAAARVLACARPCLKISQGTADRACVWLRSRTARSTRSEPSPPARSPRPTSAPRESSFARRASGPSR